MYASIILRKGKEQSLKRYHPWVFSGAIAQADQSLEEGDLVRVIGHEGEFLGVGHYQIGSIAVRILSFRDIIINSDFWKESLNAALRLRRDIGVIRDDNKMYRLVHGEGDGLPGLIIDIYGDAAIMQAHSVGMHRQRKEIAAALQNVLGSALATLYYKSDSTLPFKAALNDETGFLLGAPKDVVASENGLNFCIDWLKGQKTGFFLDQRDNRALVEQYAKGRRVLNMFCYTGGFSVYAIRGGASIVHSVDSSERAIEVTDQNVALNFPDCKCHKSFAADAFKFMSDMPDGRCDKADNDLKTPQDDGYDLIILDPPAFAKHRDALHNALKGYTRLNAKAIQKIKPGGILFTFSCSQAVNKEQFRLAVFTAAAQCQRFVRVLHQLHQPADHPVSIYHPEGEYLKGLVLQIE